jgi:hypothetical protein
MMMKPRKMQEKPIWKKRKMQLRELPKMSKQLEKYRKKLKRTTVNPNQMLMKLQPLIKHIRKKYLRNLNPVMKKTNLTKNLLMTIPVKRPKNLLNQQKKLRRRNLTLQRMLRKILVDKQRKLKAKKLERILQAFQAMFLENLLLHHLLPNDPISQT